MTDTITKWFEREKVLAEILREGVQEMYRSGLNNSPDVLIYLHNEQYREDAHHIAMLVKAWNMCEVIDDLPHDCDP